MDKKNDIEIKGIVESSLLDWDKKIVTTIYLPKCNFRCPFCHNWELIETPEKFNTITLPQLDRHLRSNQDFLDGVCITGGEPTIYKSLTDLIEHIRIMGLKVKLDTNGTNPSLLKELIDDQLVDYIAMDVKGPIDERYNKLSGISVNLKKIEESIDIIKSSSIEYEFRTTIVPTLLTDQDVYDICSSLSGAKKYAVQQYVPNHARDEQLRNIKPFDNEVLQHIKKEIESNFTQVVLRGLK